MLVELSCDKFMSYGILRPPIHFENGLNVIKGGSESDNSVGKSTLLMIIDFVFGGNTYQNSQNAKHIGLHTIKFAFRFSDGMHYYTRSTSNPNEVIICNKNYEPSKIITTDDYTKELAKYYHIEEKEKYNFRNLLRLFFRIAGNKNENSDVLDSTGHDTMSDSIAKLEILFNLYDKIGQLRETAKNTKESLSAFKSAEKFNHIDGSVKYKKDVKTKDKELLELRYELATIEKQADIELTQTQIEQTDEISKLKNTLVALNIKRGTITRKIDYLEKQNDIGKCTFQKSTFEKLRKFFPDTNIKELEKIESFHGKITEILKTEFSDEIKTLKAQQKLLENQIQKLEDDIRNAGFPITLSREKYEQIGKISEKIKNAEIQKENYETRERLKAEKSAAKTALVEGEQDILKKIEEKINSKIKNFCLFIETEKLPPKLELLNGSSYKYKTLMDNGTGTKERDRILFDLAMLNLTKVPVLVHDSYLFANMENNRISKIIQLYEKQSKQIFIAFDKNVSFSSEAETIIRQKTRIELSKNGNELFGEFWSKNNTE